MNHIWFYMDVGCSAAEIWIFSCFLAIFYFSQAEKTTLKAKLQLVKSKTIFTCRGQATTLRRVTLLAYPMAVWPSYGEFWHSWITWITWITFKRGFSEKKKTKMILKLKLQVETVAGQQMLCGQAKRTAIGSIGDPKIPRLTQGFCCWWFGMPGMRHFFCFGWVFVWKMGPVWWLNTCLQVQPCRRTVFFAKAAGCLFTDVFTTYE